MEGADAVVVSRAVSSVWVGELSFETRPYLAFGTQERHWLLRNDVGIYLGFSWVRRTLRK